MSGVPWAEQAPWRARQAATFDRRRGSVRHWLLSIVHHHAIDWLRSRSNGHDDVQFNLVERTLYAPDTWQTVSAYVERDVIRRALAALPAEQQRTVELAYFGGYSQPEIAAAMGVPPGRQRRALVALAGAAITAQVLAEAGLPR